MNEKNVHKPDWIFDFVNVQKKEMSLKRIKKDQYGKLFFGYWSYALILFSLLISSSASAQSKSAQIRELSNDLESLKNEMYGKGSLAFKISYHTFYSYTDKTPEEVEEALFICDGQENFYLKNSQTISVHEKGKTLVIDKRAKKMLLFSQNLFLNELSQIPKDSILQLCSSIELISNSFRNTSWKLSFEGSIFQYKSIIISYDKKSLHLNKVILFLANEVVIDDGNDGEKKILPKMEINYQKVELKKSQLLKLSINSYIQSSESNFEARPPFAGYEIIDNTQND